MCVFISSRPKQSIEYIILYHLISFYLILSHSISSPLLLFYFILFPLIPSPLLLFYFILSCLFSPCFISAHFIPSISSHQKHINIANAIKLALHSNAVNLHISPALQWVCRVFSLFPFFLFFIFRRESIKREEVGKRGEKKKGRRRWHGRRGWSNI